MNEYKLYILYIYLSMQLIIRYKCYYLSIYHLCIIYVDY